MARSKIFTFLVVGELSEGTARRSGALSRRFGLGDLGVDHRQGVLGAGEFDGPRSELCLGDANPLQDFIALCPKFGYRHTSHQLSVLAFTQPCSLRRMGSGCAAALLAGTP